MNTLTNKDIQSYREDGFVVLRDFFREGSADDLLKAANYQFYLNAMKVMPDHEVFSAGLHPERYVSLEELDAICTLLDNVDPVVFKEAQAAVQSNPLASSMGSNAILLKCVSQLLECPGAGISSESIGAAIVPSLPGNARRLYTWHSEATWLPYRRRFVNAWSPLFRPKKPGTGTMHVLSGSHKKEGWAFGEHYGFDRSSFGDESHYLQYEIPECELEQFEEVAIEAAEGDLCLFDRNLVHKSEVNESKDIGYVWIARYFDTRMDLTVSANLNQRPYNASAPLNGRPGLRPVMVDGVK